MKYEAEINGRQINIEIDQREGHVVARVEQRAYDLEVVMLEEGLYLFFAGDQVYEARVWPAESGSLYVKLRDNVFAARIIDRKHRRPAAEQGAEGQQLLTSPMPGKVVRVLLKQGDEVAQGQGIIIVEAMKMQNEIKSARAGRIAEIRVAEGATVNANQVLAVVE